MAKYLYTAESARRLAEICKDVIEKIETDLKNPEVKERENLRMLLGDQKIFLSELNEIIERKSR